MGSQAVKVRNEESGITEAASQLRGKVSGSLQETREFLHETRVEMKQVTWPTRNDVISTTAVVLVTVFFFGIFLSAVDWLVLRGVHYIFKLFGVGV